MGKDGVTVLTSWTTYIEARFRPARPEDGETVRVTYIESADALSCLDLIDWLTAPDEFILGRLDNLGTQGAKLSDEEIPPGFVGQPMMISKNKRIGCEEFKAAARPA